MPFYRMGAGVVHIKMGKGRAPAQCRAPFELDGKMGHCCAMSSFLCDHQTEDDDEPCNMPLCAEHAHEIGKDRHLCPRHMAERKDPELF